LARHAVTLRRKPRTRRERMLVRLHATREEVGRRWERLRHRRSHRVAQRRAQELFLQLGHRLHPEAAEPAVPARRGRLHVRYHR
jgi:hypothetical protein